MPSAPWKSLVLSTWAAYRVTAADEVLTKRCLESSFPESRSELPQLLNCLGLLREAVEVGVQAGVHAHHFLEKWKGDRLRLVDLWGEAGSETNLFYVDIANVHGLAARRQHRLQCEERLERSLRSGHAEVLHLESAMAAEQIEDGELDFVYLDARHDLAGVVADIHAWWPKVHVGGIFAGHDFVDGEFPEGDFFWITALNEALPGLGGDVHVIRERNRYPSFFILKSSEMSSLVPKQLDTMELTLKLYASRSKYFDLWARLQGTSNTADFLSSCKDTCGGDCSQRVSNFTPSRSAVSTLRPFACAQETCGSEVTLDVDAYHQVCLERCAVTCQQRLELFEKHGDQILASRA